MKLSTAALLILGAASSQAAFVPSLRQTPSKVILKGYLDDLSKELYAEEDNPDIEGSLKVNTDATQAEKDRFGVGDWDKYVEFDEFDGGDGQMGVAGDGKKGLEKFGSDVQPQLAKSRSMSAKNAWGTSSGYADQLLDSNPAMDVSRAQQLENWQNQREVRARQVQMKEMTELAEVGKSEEESWRELAKFGVERNEDFDLDSAFGAVTPGPEIEATLELHSAMGRVEIAEFGLKNEYMGFADFRAAFTPETPSDWTVTPNEGSLQSKEATDFIVKFRPNNPGVSEGYLVIETEDFKKTWKLIGGTA